MKYVDEAGLPQLTDDAFAAARATARPYTVCILRPGPAFEMPSPDRRDGVTAIIWEHGRRNVALHQAGILHVVCPIADGGDVAGIGIFSETPEEVDRIMSADPAVLANVLTYELHACRSFPGSTLPDHD